MKRCGIVVAIAGLLLFSSTAWAEEQTKNDGHTDGGHGTTEVQPTPAEQKEVINPDMEMTPEEHENMNMGGNSDPNGANGTKPEEGTSEGEHGGGHGSKEVVETPPNIPVLSAFGGIMLAFILYGAWNKFLRKKERAHA